MPVYKLGNGADFFDSAVAPGWANASEVYGENGKDRIIASGSGILGGGNGDDVVSVLQFSGILNGGRGDDQFNSVGSSVNITGGHGVDRFSLDSFSHVFVTNSDASYGDVLSEGDKISGVFDRITDYQAGELLQIGATTNVGTVDIDEYRAGHQHLILPDGGYGIVRGNRGDEFEVSSSGADLLVVYRRPDAYWGNEPFYHGGVILVGFADASSVLIG